MIITLYIEDKPVKKWVRPDIRFNCNNEEETKKAQKLFQRNIDQCKEDYERMLPGGMIFKKFYFFVKITSRMNKENFITSDQQKIFNKKVDLLRVNKIAKKYKNTL